MVHQVGSGTYLREIGEEAEGTEVRRERKRLRRASLDSLLHAGGARVRVGEGRHEGAGVALTLRRRRAARSRSRSGWCSP